MARNDPYPQYNFILEIEGTTAAGFAEVGGLTMEQDIIEYREGSDTPSVRKNPGLAKYANITLKRGITDSDELWLWRKTTIDGVTERKSGAVILRNEAGQAAVRWEFREGWISKYEGPALKATANEVAMESIEIAVEHVARV
jgi:phage tail-like protein